MWNIALRGEGIRKIISLEKLVQAIHIQFVPTVERGLLDGKENSKQ